MTSEELNELLRNGPPPAVGKPRRQSGDSHEHAGQRGWPGGDRTHDQASMSTTATVQPVLDCASDLRFLQVAVQPVHPRIGLCCGVSSMDQPDRPDRRPNGPIRVDPTRTVPITKPTAAPPIG